MEKCQAKQEVSSHVINNRLWNVDEPVDAI